MVSYPCAGSVMEQVTAEDDNAFLSLKGAWQMFYSEPAVACDLARQGSVMLLAEIQKNGIPFRGDFVYTWKPEDVLQILLGMDLNHEALSLALALIEVRPVDLQLLLMTSKIMSALAAWTKPWLPRPVWSRWSRITAPGSAF